MMKCNNDRIINDIVFADLKYRIVYTPCRWEIAK